MLTNSFVAASNIFGIFALFACKTNGERALVSLTIVASILMHLSETKHSLPGIYPFNLYSWHFLQLDRIMAVVAMSYCCTRLNYLSPHSIFVGILGLLSMFLSERFERGQLWFATFHCIWHAIAYSILYMIIGRE